MNIFMYKVSTHEILENITSEEKIDLLRLMKLKKNIYDVLAIISCKTILKWTYKLINNNNMVVKLLNCV